ncbi:CAP domain-containing protein [Streptomyces shenzhenensis]|uniref:CAP domain-containing protein n=1 Tax=Streptomyces shenzhenensis TaxID=943815 RepID=UPI0015F01D94|nr:CAP domain-containing protein [Streptomyces shenzhenensis]
MGRHRRHAAGRAATGRPPEVTESNDWYPGDHDPQDSFAALRYGKGTAAYLHQDGYAETNARSSAYLYATDDDYAGETGTAVFPAAEFSPSGGGRSGSAHRRRKKAGRPVATGLLGVSAAVAIGTVAVATGMVPGLENYKLGGGSGTTGGERVQAAGEPSNTAAEQGGTSGSAESRGTGSSTSRDSRRPTSPTAPASTSASASASTSASASPSPTPTRTATEEPTSAATPSGTPGATSSRTATQAPVRTAAPITTSAEAVAQAEVLKLVNEERAKVGCSALSANSSLTQLAESFSDDMAARDFFDHTDPNGNTPWDRAAAAGISDLGGENIARGQATAQAVMDAWMNSEGHRANILNCDFKTLGVGVHFGEGGPWWTQDFGY